MPANGQNDSQSQLITPVILSGGSGTRLWPLSREARPKQLLALTCEQTMLQMTALRAADRRLFEAPIVVANERHGEEIDDQLREIGVDAAAIFLEPIGRNTAAAIAAAALIADEDAVLLVMPSDHVIADTGAFKAAIETATPLAENGWLVTFGLIPTHAETGFGYIKAGDELRSGARRVAQFAEKPTLALAEQYVGDGYFWNGGIFLFQAKSYLAALSEHAPSVLSSVGKALAEGADEKFRRPSTDAFARCPSISIDYAVMEKAENVAVVPVEMGWSDVGSWDALRELSGTDVSENVVHGEVILSGSNGCTVRSSGPLVAGVGLENLIIIATPDAVLVLPKGRSQDVKLITDELKARGHTSLVR